MTRYPDKVHNSGEKPEDPSSDVLHRVLEKNRMAQVRREIGIIADRSYDKKLISEEAYRGYREVAERKESHIISVSILKSTREFAEKHEEKAVRIHRKIQLAVTKKIASEKDEEFLMEALVAKNMKFVEQAGEIEALIDGKLERMRRDRERYDRLANHSAIRDTWCLRIDDNTQIDFPKEDLFLAMTVPERRELLDKIEAALSKAEGYTKERTETEESALTEKYVMKLDKAEEEGIIGRHTYDSFMNGFRKISREEKERWNQEFDDQMERYRELWGQIRTTLRGEALKKMEGMVNTSGYTEIFSAFGSIRKTESDRLKTGYAKKLQEYRKEGIIGQCVIAQLTLQMGQQNLFDQYEAEKNLPGEILSYKKLWQKIGQLPKKQQNFLRSKIDDWSYDELEREYNRLTDNEESDENKAEKEAINQIRSGDVKEAITETDEILSEYGGGQKRKTFINLLDKMFQGVNRDTFDATSFETEIRKKAMKINPEMKHDLKGRGVDDEVDFDQIEEDTEVLERTGNANIRQDQGFIEVESNVGGQMTRHTQVTINEGRGLERLLSEDGKNNYRNTEFGGNDDLSLAVYTSGKTIELDLREVRSLRDYLKKKEENECPDEAV